METTGWIKKISVCDIIGHKAPIEAITDRLITYREEYIKLKSLGVSGVGGLLLYGLPGTGKTICVEASVNDLNTINQGKFILDKKKACHFTAGNSLGRSELKLEEFYNELQTWSMANPTMTRVLFFDEFDAVCPSREQHQLSQNTTERVNAFLTFMVDVQNKLSNVFIIACTNRPEKIDEAILSRFYDQVEVPKPTVEEYKLFADKFINCEIISGDKEDIKKAIANAGNFFNWTGRDFDNLRTKLAIQYVKKGIPLDAKEITKICQDLKIVRWSTVRGD